jgi:hypothetical protein
LLSEKMEDRDATAMEKDEAIRQKEDKVASVA